MEEFSNNEYLEIQPPPFSIELEQQILGSVLVDDRLIKKMVDTVKVDAFYHEDHKDIYKGMLYLYHHNLPIEGYVALIDRMKIYKREDLAEYIIDLPNSVISISTFESKLELFTDIYRKRVLYQLYKKRLTNSLEGIASSNLVKEIEEKIEGMGVTSNLHVDKFEDYINVWLEDQENDMPLESFKLGYKGLDDKVLLMDTNLMLIGARPSTGKSAFATNLVKNFCLQGKHPLFVSLEMSKKEFMNRLVANMAGVEARKLKRKEYKTNEEWTKILKTKEEIKNFKFNFYDKGGMKIEMLKGLCKVLKKKGKLDVLVIDYLQLLQSNQYKNQRTQQVGFISHELKMLAQELEIPVIALAQLSRASIGQDGKPREPQLSDLRESGDLENDANIILMLHTEDINQEFVDKRFVDILIRKNRDGTLGKVKFEYQGDYLKFIEKEWNEKTYRYEEVEQEDLTILPDL